MRNRFFTWNKFGRALALTGLLLPAGCAYQQQIAQGDALLARGQYPQALQTYRDAQQRTLRFSEIDAAERTAQASAQWSAALERQARELAAAGHAGAALLLALQADRLDSRPATRELASQLRNRVHTAALYPVLLRSPAPEAPALFDRLRDALSGDPALRLLEHAEGASAAMLQLDLGPVEFTGGAREETRTVQYRVGTRRLANPAFGPQLALVDSLARDLPAAQVHADVAGAQLAAIDRDLARLESDLREARRQHDRAKDDSRRGERDIDSRNPGNDRDDREHKFWDRRLDDLNGRLHELQRVRVQLIHQREGSIGQFNGLAGRLDGERLRLAQTPEWIDEPIMQDHTFPVEVVERVARRPMRIIVEHRDGRPPRVVEKQMDAAASGERHDAQPVAGVPARSPNLPDADALQRQLLERIEDEVQRALRDSLEGRRTARLAEAAAATGDAARLDLYADYLLSNPKTIDGGARKAIDQLGRQFAQIDNATQLLTAP